MPEDEGKQDKFDFTAEGEALRYISLPQATLLAMQTARETPGDYIGQFSGVPMAFEVVASNEDEDYYTITLSFRPQGQFSGTPGQEQFFIEKEGVIAHRQLLSLPVASRGSRFPVMPLVIGLLVVGAAAAVVGVVLVGGVSVGDSSAEFPVAVAAPTDTPPAGGEQSAKDAEWDAVQSAIDIMMADQKFTRVTAGGAAAIITNTFDFDPSAGAQTLGMYMRDAKTTYCYTWDSSGKVLTQAEASGSPPVCGEPAQLVSHQRDVIVNPTATLAATPTATPTPTQALFQRAEEFAGAFNARDWDKVYMFLSVSTRGQCFMDRFQFRSLMENFVDQYSAWQVTDVSVSGREGQVTAVELRNGIEVPDSVTTERWVFVNGQWRGDPEC